MKKILLILAGVGTVATFVSAYCTKQRGNNTLPVPGGKEHDCDENKESEAYILAVREFGSAFFKHLYAQNPSISHSVSGHQALTISGQMGLHTSGDRKKNILKLLKIKNKQKIIKIIRSVLNRLEAKKNLVDIKFEAIANTSNHITTAFKNNYKELCDGKIININFNNHYEVETCANQLFSPPKNREFDLEKYNFRRNGVLFTSIVNFEVDFNHINNPTGVKLVYFHVNENTILKLPAIYGNAFVEYGEDLKLGTQILKMPINGGKCYLVIIMPKDPKNMSRVVEKYSKVTEFDKVVKSLKPMCVKLTLCIGAAHMTHKMTPYLQRRGLFVNGYKNVFVNGMANVNDIQTQVHLTARNINKRATIHSPKCQKDSNCMPEMIINKHILYWAVCDNIPVVCGSYTGYSHGGGQ